ncbi:MAG: LemA family protein [Planctomycetes bacterium]|nr:LemA family protein [Planctomycetota bacterium]
MGAGFAGLGIVLVVLGGIALVLVVVALWGVGVYNALTRGRIGAQGAFSGIDVELKRRHDLVPNLVNTVKGYAAHEKQTLDAVISARASATRPNLSMEQRLQAEQGLSGALGRLMAVAEAYPDLKANQNFLQLQGELSQIENRIAGARGGYNGAAEGYNAMARQFPALLVARLFGFQDMPFFQVDDPAQRNAPVVQF